MASSMWAQVVDALLGQCRAQAGYRDPATQTNDVPVFDSSQIGVREDFGDAFLVVAYSGDPDNEAEVGGSAGQQVASLDASKRAREERGGVRCLAVAQNGDAVPKTARDLAFSVVATVEAVCRTNPTLGIVTGAAGQLFWAQVASLDVKNYMDSGAVCQIEFTVDYFARI